MNGLHLERVNHDFKKYPHHLWHLNAYKEIIFFLQFPSDLNKYRKYFNDTIT